MINDLLERIGFERFTIRVNNRLVLNGVLETLGLRDQSVGVLRALDKLPKIGRDAVAGELIEKVGISADQARQVLDFAQLGGTPDDILSQLRQLIAGNESGEQGLANLA